jgi:predicted RNase H-like nuclease (RuvC/YqgF family)
VSEEEKVDKGFELLEQKVRKAAELVKRLQGENKALGTQLAEAQSRLKQAARDLEAAEKRREPSAEEARKLEALQREVQDLRGEREEIKTRVARLVEVLDTLD